MFLICWVPLKDLSLPQALSKILAYSPYIFIWCWENVYLATQQDCSDKVQPSILQKLKAKTNTKSVKKMQSMLQVCDGL